MSDTRGGVRVWRRAVCWKETVVCLKRWQPHSRKRLSPGERPTKPKTTMNVVPECDEHSPRPGPDENQRSRHRDNGGGTEAGGKHPKLYRRRPGLALGCQNVRKSRVPKVVSQGAEWTVGLGTSMRTGRLSKKGNAHEDRGYIGPGANCRRLLTVCPQRTRKVSSRLAAGGGCSAEYLAATTSIASKGGFQAKDSGRW